VPADVFLQPFARASLIIIIIIRGSSLFDNNNRIGGEPLSAAREMK
jgi:hypothetical protein